MTVIIWDTPGWVHMGTLGPAQRVLPQMHLTQPAVAQELLRSDGNSDILDMFCSWGTCGSGNKVCWVSLML